MSPKFANTPAPRFYYRQGMPEDVTSHTFCDNERKSLLEQTGNG
jgi:hypothetical protein